VLAVGIVLAAGGAVVATASSSSVDFGDISHSGLKDLGAAPTGSKLVLELGLKANVQGIQDLVKSSSNPASSSYGKWISLSTLQSKYGATSSVRNAVVGAFKPYKVTATVDVTHLRVGATISIGNAQKLFGTKCHPDRRLVRRRVLPLGESRLDTPREAHGNARPAVRCARPPAPRQSQPVVCAPARPPARDGRSPHGVSRQS
jgi:hypothetical protein